MKKFFIGVDVSKDTVDVSFFDDDRMSPLSTWPSIQTRPRGSARWSRTCACVATVSAAASGCSVARPRVGTTTLCATGLLTTAWWSGERAPSKSSGRSVSRGARTTGWTRCESPSTPGATRTRCRSS